MVIAVDAHGHAYIGGETFSADFPTRNAFQDTLQAIQTRCDEDLRKIENNQRLERE